MPLDGAGNYIPPSSSFPAIPGDRIEAEKFNEVILDLAEAISTAIFRDGQVAWAANQSVGGFKLTNLGNGVNASDAVNFLQVFVNPTFTATVDAVEGVKITGTAFTVTTTTVSLPYGTTIGDVTPAEIGMLSGITGNIQGLLAQKANLQGGNTFTELQTMQAALSDGSTAVTQDPSDASNKIATTDFVAQSSFSAVLPAQAGNGGKWMRTNGTSASWATIPVAPEALLSLR